MDQYERRAETHFDLYVAVFGGDLAEAQRILSDAIATGDFGSVLIDAKRKACPLPPPPQLERPEVFPVLGHLPGSTLGRPHLGRAA